MNAWHELQATCTQGTFTPPHHPGDDDGAPLACDLLGIFPIPVTEMQAAARLGITTHLLRRFFPRITARVALSRGRPYYRIEESRHAVPLLSDAIRRLDLHAGGDLPALRFASVENLHNVFAATAYRLWEILTDCEPSATAPARCGLVTLLDAAARLAAELVGASRVDPTHDAFPAESPPIQGPFRVFRELDSQWKIGHEIRYLLNHVINPDPGLHDIVIPLYGSVSLGLAARAALRAAQPDRDIDVHLVRLGFHDLGHLDFFTGSHGIDAALTAPPDHRASFARRVAGKHVLVVDDNVGRGATLRAARTLVEQHGGRATTRSVETAWHLYDHSGRHDISTAADLPSLRPNLYHAIHSRLVSHLLRGDTVAYIDDPAHAVPAELRHQMLGTLDLAYSLGHWTSGQLAAMRTELAHATLAWREPAVPAPPAPGMRATCSRT